MQILDKAGMCSVPSRPIFILLVGIASMLFSGICAATCPGQQQPDYEVDVIFKNGCPTEARVKDAGDACDAAEGGKKCLRIAPTDLKKLLIKWQSVNCQDNSDPNCTQTVDVEEDFSIIFDPTMGPQHKSKGTGRVCKRLSTKNVPFANKNPGVPQKIRFKYTVATMKEGQEWNSRVPDPACPAHDPVIIVDY